MALRAGEGGQQHRCKNTNDGYDHEQFNQGEGRVLLTLIFHCWLGLLLSFVFGIWLGGRGAPSSELASCPYDAGVSGVVCFGERTIGLRLWNGMFHRMMRPSAQTAPALICTGRIQAGHEIRGSKTQRLLLRGLFSKMVQLTRLASPGGADWIGLGVVSPCFSC